MTRRRLMAKLPGRQYISEFRFPLYGNKYKLSTAVCLLKVRKTDSGSNSKEHIIGRWKVKTLKPKAYTEFSIAPGTYSKFYENQKALKN